MGNTPSTTNPVGENTPIQPQKDIKIKVAQHTNPEKDKGGICPICGDPKCGYMTS